MRPEHAADHSPPSSATVMEEYSYTSTHSLGHTGPVMGSLCLHVSGDYLPIIRRNNFVYATLGTVLVVLCG